MTIFKKDAPFVKSLIFITRLLLIVASVLAMSYWLLHFPLVAVLIGAAVGIGTALLIYVFRNRWGDTITINNHSICIERNGKQSIEIAYSSINIATAKKDSLSMIWKAEDKSGFLCIAKERFSDSTWSQLMQCMEASLSAAGVKLSTPNEKSV